MRKTNTYVAEALALDAGANVGGAVAGVVDGDEVGAGGVAGRGESNALALDGGGMSEAGGWG